MKKTAVATTLLAALATFAALPAAAVPDAAVQTANGSTVQWRGFIGSNQYATVGWSFTVGATDMPLTALGLFDFGVDGLYDAHPVGIWNDSGTLLASAVVPAGTGGVLLGEYRYVSVAPLTLQAGQGYRVGAYFGPVESACSGSACGDQLLYNGTETYAPGIFFGQALQTLAANGNGSLAFPDLNAGVPEGVFGPNFLLNESLPVVPEPSSLALFGVGLAALIATAARRRRRTAH